MSFIRRHIWIALVGAELRRARGRGQRDRQRRRGDQHRPARASRVAHRALHGIGAAAPARAVPCTAIVVVRHQAGFVTVTLRSRPVESVSGQQLTLTEGTKTRDLQDGHADDPRRRPGPRQPPEGDAVADIKPGQRVIVVQAPEADVRDARTTSARPVPGRRPVEPGGRGRRGRPASATRRPSARDRPERRLAPVRAERRESARTCGARAVEVRGAGAEQSELRAAVGQQLGLLARCGWRRSTRRRRAPARGSDRSSSSTASGVLDVPERVRPHGDAAGVVDRLDRLARPTGPRAAGRPGGPRSGRPPGTPRGRAALGRQPRRVRRVGDHGLGQVRPADRLALRCARGSRRVVELEAELLQGVDHRAARRSRSAR